MEESFARLAILALFAKALVVTLGPESTSKLMETRYLVYNSQVPRKASGYLEDEQSKHAKM